MVQAACSEFARARAKVSISVGRKLWEISLAKSSKIKIMISSRCNDRFPLAGKDGNELGRLRAELRQEIEDSHTLGRPIYEVWIHEEASASAERDAWDECIRQARDCDIFVALYNGNAGWKGAGDFATIGICDAEYQAACDNSPAKVVVIDIFERDAVGVPSGGQHRVFQERILKDYVFSSRPRSPTELVKAVKQAIAVRTIELTQAGTKLGRRGRGYLGPALDWRRLNYRERSTQMVASMVVALSAVADTDGACGVKIGSEKILFLLAAIPDSLSVASAREIVGQPHLADHATVKAMKQMQGGPVHLIACHKGATEAQAQRMLGFPNVTIVPAPFGIYVADPVQGIQLVLLSNCTDDQATRAGVQRFMDWLSQSNQISIFVRTARKRRKVVNLLAGSP